MGNLNESPYLSTPEEKSLHETTDLELDLEVGENRPRSWSPADNTAQILLKTHGLGELPNNPRAITLNL